MCSKTPLTIRVMINDHVYHLSIVIMSSRSGYISWTTDDGGKDFHLLLMRRPPAISIPGKTILQTNNVKMMKLLATCYQTWALVINSNIVLREIEITWQGRHVRGCEANKSSRGCVVESPKAVLMRTFMTIVRDKDQVEDDFDDGSWWGWNCHLAWDPCAITPGWPLVVGIVRLLIIFVFLAIPDNTTQAPLKACLELACH